MKKIFFSLITGCVCFLAACSGKKEEGGGVSATTKKNLEVNAAIGKSFETGDFSKIGDYLSEDFVDYAGMTGPVKGIEANKKAWSEMMANMDSAKSVMSRSLGDDEYVFSMVEMSGICKKDMMGMKAGQKMEGKSLEVTQFKDGKAIAHWTYMTPDEMMKMMGNMPPMPPSDGSMKSDTTKKGM